MSTQALFCEIAHLLVVVVGHEAIASINIDRAKPVDNLFAQIEDRQIALLEGLLVSSQLTSE